jgi:RimJ/RimL family protein N-acetyltransferase
MMTRPPRADDLADELDVELSCGGVHLRSPSDHDARTLARLAATPGAVLSDAERHFVTWLDEPPDQIAANLISEIREHRRLPRRGHWTLDFAIVIDGEIVGLQRLSGFDRWPLRRNVGTSSWIVAAAQSHGYGTRARVAVLDLAFEALKAEAALSWTLPLNDRSRRLCERLGYDLIEPASGPAQESKYRLRAAQWPHRRPTTLPRTSMNHINLLRGVLAPRG